MPTRSDEQTHAGIDGKIGTTVRNKKNRIRAKDEGGTNENHYKYWRSRANNLPVIRGHKRMNID